MGKKSFDSSILIKNLTKQVQDYGKLMGERTQLEAGILSNQIKGRQNWFWKMKEQNESPLGRQFRQQRQQGAGYQDPLSQGPIQPTMTGYKQTKLTEAEIGRKIQAKRIANSPLTNLEKKFEEDRLTENEKYYRDIGKAEGGKTQWSDIRKNYIGRRDETIKFEEQAYMNKAISRAETYFSSVYSGNPKKLEKIMKLVNQLETPKDLEELKERESEANKKGIDVNLILEYFKKPKRK